MKRTLVGLVGVGLLAGAGCHSCERRTVPPAPCAPVAPPAPLPTTPAIAPVPAAPPAPVFPTTPPVGTRNYGPANPPGPDVRLSPPEPGTSPEPPLAQLVPPQTDVRKPAVKEQPSVEAAKPDVPTPALPVGIPQFAYAVEGKVATGLKPHPEEGFAWLQANGFRTVLRLRLPNEADDADRRLAERHGLRYRSVELSPRLLERKCVEEFSRIVADADGQPLFIYDGDGTLAGGLWYVHFRTVERLSEEQAQTQAARLGFKWDGNSEQKAMGEAIRRYLSQQP